MTRAVTQTDPTPTDWNRVFRPRTVAVLGATGRPGSHMGRPLRWLAERGFDGAVWPVNPKYDELAGLSCYPSLSALPGPVDLVLAMAPAAQTPDAVRDAGAAGAAAVIVFASGFAEVGPDGAALQRELVRAARESGVRVLGPNCQGVLYTPGRLFATFTAAAERPLEGSSGIAYVGQSGAVGGSVLDIAAAQGLDLTAWVSTGNQADVDITEIGRYLVREPEVSVLAVYLESVQDGAAYERLAVEASRSGTALVVLRSGRSDAGRRAAVSHTGAMLGDDTAFRLVSVRHGVVLVDDVEELPAQRGRGGEQLFHVVHQDDAVPHRDQPERGAVAEHRPGVRDGGAPAGVRASGTQHDQRRTGPRRLHGEPLVGGAVLDRLQVDREHRHLGLADQVPADLGDIDIGLVAGAHPGRQVESLRSGDVEHRAPDGAALTDVGDTRAALQRALGRGGKRREQATGRVEHPLTVRAEHAHP